MDFSKMWPSTSTFTSSRKLYLATVLKKSVQVVFELQIIDLVVLLEKAAVVSRGEGEAFVALVDGLEKAEEILPAGVCHPAERRHGLVRRLDALLRQEAPFASQKATKMIRSRTSSRHVDGGPRRLAVLAAKVVDQAEAVVAVSQVVFVAHLAAPALRLLQQGQRPRRLVGLGSQQTAGLEQAIELPVHLGKLREVLKVKFLAGERGLVAVVEAERHEIADDAPGTSGQGVQVVPALLNGGAAVETVVVQVGVRAFEFDHGRGFRRRVRREVAGRPVSRPNSGDGEIAPLVVRFRGFLVAVL